MSALKLVTFDFTGTLMRFRHQPNVQYLKVARRNGIELKDQSLFLPNFKTAYKSASREFPNFGAQVNMHWTKWWSHVVKNTFLNCGVQDSAALDSVAQQLIELYNTLEGWEVIPGVNDLLVKLKANGKILGVISNMDPRIHQLLTESKMKNFFDFVLCSYDARVAKPDQEIFKKALTELFKPVQPTECCHVGDSHFEDFVGATSSGWEAVYLTKGKFISSLEPDTHRSIEHLESHLLRKK